MSACNFFEQPSISNSRLPDTSIDVRLPSPGEGLGIALFSAIKVTVVVTTLLSANHNFARFDSRA